MEDREINVEAQSAETPQKGKFVLWLENFFYHYKWHTIIAVLVVIAVTVSSLQMCSKKDVDVHVVYAGSCEISMSSKNGDISEYQTLLKSISSAARDYDENGETVVDLETLYMLSNDEIRELEEKLKAAGIEKEYELNVAQIVENNSIFRDYMTYSDYYVCFISDDLYDIYKTMGDVKCFTPLAPYVEDGTELEYYDECTVYLHSTDFYLLPGVNKLPEDTLICIRAKSAVASHFNSAETNEIYRRSEDMLKNILNY